MAKYKGIHRVVLCMVRILVDLFDEWSVSLYVVTVQKKFVIVFCSLYVAAK